MLSVQYLHHHQCHWALFDWLSMRLLTCSSHAVRFKWPSFWVSMILWRVHMRNGEFTMPLSSLWMIQSACERTFAAFGARTLVLCCLDGWVSTILGKDTSVQWSWMKRQSVLKMIEISDGYVLTDFYFSFRIYCRVIFLCNLIGSFVYHIKVKISCLLSICSKFYLSLVGIYVKCRWTESMLCFIWGQILHRDVWLLSFCS